MGWHCDDEPLFGKFGNAKLIVSMSLGSSAVFRWRRQWVDFLAAEHRLIPARVRGEWSFGRRGWLPFGLLLRRILLMLVMLGLVLSVCVVLSFLFLLLLQVL